MHFGTRLISHSALSGFFLISGVHLIVALSGHENIWTFAGLQALQSDAHARVQTLNDEAARVGANDKLPADEKRRILREKYSAVMGPVLAELEAHAAALSAGRTSRAIHLSGRHVASRISA